jgi:hypothetical protein
MPRHDPAGGGRTDAAGGRNISAAENIDAVADYVLAHIKGAGDPTYAECVAFFSTSSRVCDIYKTPSQQAGDAAAGTEKSQ